MLIFKDLTWKNNQIGYCGRCASIILVCSECKNASCNGSGCDKCIDDFHEFSRYTKKIFDKLEFLTELLGQNEDRAFQKIFENK